MKKLIASTLLAASAASGIAMVESEPALAQNKYYCEPVHNELGGVNERLNSEIKDLSRIGIEAHVQLLEESQSEGITNYEEVKKFVEEQAVACGWTGNILNIFVSFDPTNRDIYRESGLVENLISQSEADNADASFVEVLKQIKNGDKSKSEAVNATADLLNTLENYASNSTRDNQNDQETIAPEPSNDNQEESDFPWGIIGVSIGALIISGAVATRSIKGIKLTKNYRRSLDEFNSTNSALYDSITNATRLTDILHKDDAKDLRDALNICSNDLVSLTEESAKLFKSYSSQVVRFWPNTDVVLLDSKTVSKLEKIKQNATKTISFVKEVEDYTVQNKINLVKTEENITDIKIKSEAFIKEGWDIAKYTQLITEYDDKLTNANDLIEKLYVEKPGDMLTQLLSDTNKLISDLESLVTRRNQADLMADVLQVESSELKDSADKAKAEFDLMKDEYALSCLDDIRNSNTNIDTLLSELDELNSESVANISIRSLQSVEKAEQAQSDIQITIKKVNDEIKNIYNRKELLLKIKDNLPQNVQYLDTRILNIKSYADENNTDIEKDTHSSIKNLEEELVGLKIHDLLNQKPEYLKIDKKINWLNKELVRAMNTAINQKNEMDMLRSNIQSLEHDASYKLFELKNYITQHSSIISADIESDASLIRVIKSDINGSRKELNNSVQNYNKILNRIDSLLSTASLQVAEEERRRREEVNSRVRQSGYRSSRSQTSNKSSNGGSSRSSGGHSGGSF